MSRAADGTVATDVTDVDQPYHDAPENLSQNCSGMPRAFQGKLAIFVHRSAPQSRGLPSKPAWPMRRVIVRAEGKDMERMEHMERMERMEIMERIEG